MVGGKNNSATEADDISMTNTIDSHVIIAIKAISIILILTVICGLNFLVCYTIHKKSHLQNTGNRFIFSMALSNFVYGATVLPFNFVSCILGEWYFGVVMCNVTGFVTMTIFAGSMLSIVVITVDRYFAILQPMVYQSKLTSRRTKEIIASIWILSFFAGLPPLFGWSRYTWLQSTSNCLVQWDSNPSYAYTFTSVFLVLPLCVLCYCYGRILRVARLSTRRTSNGNNILPMPEYDPTIRRRSRRTSLLVNIRMNSPTKAIKTVLITLSALFLTIGPLSVMLLFQAINGADSVPVAVTIASTWLFFCSFIANSCIYAVWNKSIRRELLGYCCVQCLGDYDDALLFQPIRRSSKAISISDSIPDTTKSRNGSVSAAQDDDSGSALKSIEESADDTESLCLSESLGKAMRRKRSGSPVSVSSRSSYRSSLHMSSLPVVAEVQLPGAVCDGEEDINNETHSGRT